MFSFNAAIKLLILTIVSKCLPCRYFVLWIFHQQAEVPLQAAPATRWAVGKWTCAGSTRPRQWSCTLKGSQLRDVSCCQSLIYNNRKEMCPYVSHPRVRSAGTFPAGRACPLTWGCCLHDAAVHAWRQGLEKDCAVVTTGVRICEGMLTELMFDWNKCLNCGQQPRSPSACSWCGWPLDIKQQSFFSPRGDLCRFSTKDRSQTGWTPERAAEL